MIAKKFKTEKLEKTLSNFFGRKYCTLVGSGTTGLFLAIKSLNLPKDSEIIVPNLTCLVIPISVSLSNFKPVFVDINPKDYNLNSELIEEKISSKTKAIIAVHSFGSSFDIDRIREICNNRGIFLIEDFCQSFGGVFEESLHGNFGDISVTSFSIGKTMKTFGGGAIFTDDNKIYTTLKSEIKKLKPINWASISNRILFDDYKNPPNALTSRTINLLCKPLNKKINLLGLAKYIFAVFYYINRNIFLHKLTESQYISIIENLGKINLIKKTTQRQAKIYKTSIKDKYFTHPEVELEKGIFWKYSITVKNISRNILFKKIEEMGYKVFQDLNFGSSYYPPFSKCWKSPSSFPISDYVSSNIINLPVGISINNSEIENLCDILNRATNEIESKA